MAENGERRMVFDTRGRRKNVIRVVYACLALLMGASLFVAVGPFNIGELIGNGASGSAADSLHEQAERIEGRIAEEPKNEALLLNLARTRIAAGNSQLEVGAEGTATATPLSARKDFEAGMEAWYRYLNLVGKENANANAAQLVAGTYFGLAERGSSTLREVQDNVNRAVGAQRIAAAQQPSLGSLSTLAIYEYFAGNMKAGDAAKQEAIDLAATENEAKGIEQQMDQYRKNAVRFNKQVEQAKKAEAAAGGGQAQNPFQGLTPGLGQ